MNRRCIDFLDCVSVGQLMTPAPATASGFVDQYMSAAGSLSRPRSFRQEPPENREKDPDRLQRRGILSPRHNRSQGPGVDARQARSHASGLSMCRRDVWCSFRCDALLQLGPPGAPSCFWHSPFEPWDHFLPSEMLTFTALRKGSR